MKAYKVETTSWDGFPVEGFFKSERLARQWGWEVAGKGVWAEEVDVPDDFDYWELIEDTQK